MTIPIVLKHMTLIDGTGNALRENAVIVIREKRIDFVGDAATPYNYHGDNAMELVWMQEAGLSPMQTIVASTANAARALEWDSWLGTLEPGKVADLIVVAANPLDNLRLLAQRRNIELVFKDGQVVAGPLPELSGVPESVMARAWICCDLPSPYE